MVKVVVFQSEKEIGRAKESKRAEEDKTGVYKFLVTDFSDELIACLDETLKVNKLEFCTMLYDILCQEPAFDMN